MGIAGATRAPARGVTAIPIGSSDWLGLMRDELSTMIKSEARFASWTIRFEPEAISTVRSIPAADSQIDGKAINNRW